MSKEQHCRSCGAKVKWVQTEKGRRMPVDEHPVDGGNLVLRIRGTLMEPLAIVVKPDANLKRFISHFATCPQSKAWRKKDE